MKNTNRKKFLKSLGTGILGLALFRNFNFEALRKKAVKDYPVKVKINPFSVSRNKAGDKNVG